MLTQERVEFEDELPGYHVDSDEGDADEGQPLIEALAEASAAQDAHESGAVQDDVEGEVTLLLTRPKQWGPFTFSLPRTQRSKNSRFRSRLRISI